MGNLVLRTPRLHHFIVQMDTAGARSPTAFMSYSHDGRGHGEWVHRLADRLVRDGVDVLFDRWDLTLGANLPLFMERGLTDSRWVIAVCSSSYVQKANGRRGGVGYESQILSADILKDPDLDHIVPILRNNPPADKIDPLPTFLRGRLYQDMNDDRLFEVGYEFLLRRLHGTSVSPKPPLGINPFEPRNGGLYVPPSMLPSRYVSPALEGEIDFAYENNSGNYEIGSGDLAFTTAWSTAGHGSTYVYKGGKTFSVACAPVVRNLQSPLNGFDYDASSRVRHPRSGDAVFLRNHQDYWAVVFIDSVTVRETDPTGEGHIRFRYLIQPDRTAAFSGADTD